MSKTPTFYTPKELMELIDHARARGVQQIKVPGFEVVWPLQPATPAAKPPTVRTRPPQTFTPPATPKLAAVPQGVQTVPKKKCPGCGDPLKQGRKMGSQCVRCYRAKSRESAEAPVCETHDASMAIGKLSNEWYCHECFVEDKKAKGLWRRG